MILMCRHKSAAFTARCKEGSKVSQTESTAHRVDWAKSGEVVFVGRVVAMPSNHIEGGEVLLCLKDPPAELVQDLEGTAAVHKLCHWCLKVSWGRQAICTCAGPIPLLTGLLEALLCQNEDPHSLCSITRVQMRFAKWRVSL